MDHHYIFLNMIQPDNVQESREKLETARQRFDSAGAGYGRRDPERNANQFPGEYFTHSQRTIEHATKAVFLLLGVEVPSDHFIEMDSNSARDLLNASEAKLSEDYTDQIARLLFINQLYGSSYPTSEYGVETSQRTIEANQFLNHMEADQAYNHADEVIELCETIIRRGAEIAGVSR